MKKLDKFILKSFIGPMLATFLIIMFILLLNVLWRYIEDLVGKGLPFPVIAELLYYMTVAMLPVALPITPMFAAIMTMGNLGENNELLAFKAAGVSLFRILRSVIIFAIVMSIASFFLFNNYVPYCFEKMSGLLYDISKQRQEIKFKDGVFFNGIPNISIRVGTQDPDTKKIDNILIYDMRDPGVAKTIVADSGYITMQNDNKYMKILLYNGHNYQDNRSYTWYNSPEMEIHSFKRQDMLMELDGFSFERSDNNAGGNRSEAKDLKALSYDIDSLSVVAENSIYNLKRSILYHNLFMMDTLVIANSDSVKTRPQRFLLNSKSIDTLNNEVKGRIFDEATAKLSNIRMQSEMGHSEVGSSTIVLYRTKADWQRKFALPVSVFIFFLIGAPLGAIIRKGGLGLPSVISVLFFILYYMLTMLGKKWVEDGVWHPFVGMWFSSFVLLPIAIFITYKAVSDSQLLSLETYYIIAHRMRNKLYERYPKLEQRMLNMERNKIALKLHRKRRKRDKVSKASLVRNRIKIK